MTARELIPLTHVEEWALPILVSACRDYARTDCHIMRFGVLLWNWMPVRVQPIDGWDYQFDVFTYPEDDNDERYDPTA